VAEQQQGLLDPFADVEGVDPLVAAASVGAEAADEADDAGGGGVDAAQRGADTVVALEPVELGGGVGDTGEGGLVGVDGVDADPDQPAGSGVVADGGAEALPPLPLDPGREGLGLPGDAQGFGELFPVGQVGGEGGDVLPRKSVARLMAAAGLLSSWPTPAASWPRVASFSDSTSRERARPSRSRASASSSRS